MTLPAPGLAYPLPGVAPQAALETLRGHPTLLARAVGRLGIPAGPLPEGGYGLGVADILEALTDLADADPAAAVDPETGVVLELHRMPGSVRRAVKRLTVETRWEGSGAEREAVGTVTRLDFHDRVRPLELLARFRGMEPGPGGAVPALRPADSGEAIAHRVFEALGRALLAAPVEVRDAVARQLGVTLPVSSPPTEAAP